MGWNSNGSEVKGVSARGLQIVHRTRQFVRKGLFQLCKKHCAPLSSQQVYLSLTTVTFITLSIKGHQRGEEDQDCTLERWNSKNTLQSHSFLSFRVVYSCAYSEAKSL